LCLVRVSTATCRLNFRNRFPSGRQPSTLGVGSKWFRRTELSKRRFGDADGDGGPCPNSRPDRPSASAQMPSGAEPGPRSAQTRRSTSSPKCAIVYAVRRSACDSTTTSMSSPSTAIPGASKSARLEVIPNPSLIRRSNLHGRVAGPSQASARYPGQRPFRPTRAETSGCQRSPIGVS
jgi:hypothetical protein